MGGNASKMGGFPMGGSTRPTGPGGRSRISTRSISKSTTTSAGGRSSSRSRVDTRVHSTGKIARDPEELTGKRGSGYRGKQNVSRSGKKCTAWADSITHTPKIYPNSGLESNFCRNPVPHEGAKTIWCFIENGTPRKFWDYCDPVITKKSKETKEVKAA
jgi:hypothetical protein